MNEGASRHCSGKAAISCRGCASPSSRSESRHEETFTVLSNWKALLRRECAISKVAAQAETVPRLVESAAQTDIYIIEPGRH
jgi:hypothetical protein